MDNLFPTTLCAEPALQRAQGEIILSVRRRNARTVLARLRQSGCLKARLPNVAPDAWTEAVLLNSSGGIASGDALSVAIHAETGSRLTITGQAAERFYRAAPGHPPATVRATIDVEDDAQVEWLPQESILFDNCALDRRLTVDLAATATFLGVEMLVFGRGASGERVEQAALQDVIHIRRAGIPVLHDAIRLIGSVGDCLDRAASTKGHRAIATLVYAAPPNTAPPDSAPPDSAPPNTAPDAEPMLDRVRSAVESHTEGRSSEAAVSAWNDLLVARFCAIDSRTLRTAVLAALGAIRGVRPMPRLWRF